MTLLRPRSWILLTLILGQHLVAAPHGGMYRGPGDMQPAPGGPRCSADMIPPPVPVAPTNSGGNPTPAGPSARVPSSGPAAGSTTPRLGIQVGEDFSKWQYWWEFNKDIYLSLKDVLHAPSRVLGSDEMYLGASRMVKARLSTKPTERDITERVLPAIHRALHEIHNRDVTSACLIALAKIGRDHPKFKILPLFRARLRLRDQEIRETAALAMGLSQMERAIPDLIELAMNSRRGQALTDRARVDQRTRSFAVYGLGLMAHAHPGRASQFLIVKQLSELLLRDQRSDRNLMIAIINALGLARPAEAAAGVAGENAATLAALGALDQFYRRKSTPGEAVIRAHVAPAVARLLGDRNDDLAKPWLIRLTRELGSTDRRTAVLSRSAALAIGQMAHRSETHADHRRYSRILLSCFEQGKDPQTRYFCLIAAAQIGGAANRTKLLGVLRTGNRALEKPWAAVALGCLEHQNRASTGNSDPVLCEAIRKAFVSAKSPYAKGAMAIALGLAGHQRAGADLLQRLASHGHQDETSGYLCVGLALMDLSAAIDPISELLDTSIRRPHRLRMAAVALGRLGDRRVSKRLIQQLSMRDLNVAKMASVATALVQIGDRHSIDALRKVLADDSVPEIARAFAVVALGGIADKESQPWNAKLAANMNYRASVETLVMSGAGILDIL